MMEGEDSDGCPGFRHVFFFSFLERTAWASSSLVRISTLSSIITSSAGSHSLLGWHAPLSRPANSEEEEDEHELSSGEILQEDGCCKEVSAALIRCFSFGLDVPSTLKSVASEPPIIMIMDDIILLVMLLPCCCICKKQEHGGGGASRGGSEDEDEEEGKIRGRGRST